MSVSSSRRHFIVMGICLVWSASLGCHRAETPMKSVDVGVQINGDCTATPDPVSIHEYDQVVWAPPSAVGDAIHFNKSPFPQHDFPNNAANKTYSGKPTKQARDCVEDSPNIPKSCSYDYTVSIPGKDCPKDPRVIITK
jgi:hypothetical protein